MNKNISKILVFSMLGIFALITINSGVAHGQSIYDVVCDVIPSLPYYEDGEFSESSNCDSPWDSVNGSYSASKLNAEQFSPPGDDGQGGYINITDDGHFSLSWRVETEFRDPQLQQSRFDDYSDGKCRSFSKDPSFVTESPAGSTSCIGSEGYSIPYQFGPAAAAGYSRGYAVTPCVEVEVEITVHAGQPAPWERRRDSMEKTIDFATQALTALVNAADSACSNFTSPPSSPPSSNPPPSNPPSSNNSQPSLQIQTSQGTHTLQPGETKNITIPDGTTAEVRAECEGVYYFFLLLHESSDGEVNPFRILFIGRGVLYATLCEWLLDGQTPASAGIVSSQSSHEILEIGVNGSGVRVQSDVPVSSLKVSTPTATVSSTGANDFNVEYSSSSGESKVSASQGSVVVNSNNGGSSKNVGSGQEVRVSNSGMGEVAPIGSSSPPSSTPPPSNNPPPSRSVNNTEGLAQFDTDGNCSLDDIEFFGAIDAWNFEEIDNELFFSAVDAWLNGTSVCAISAAKMHSLELTSIDLNQTRNNSILFSIHGQGIAHSSVQIFDLTGQEIFRSSTTGASLSWNLKDRTGQRVANGIYLYVVFFKDDHGNSVYSEVRKLAVVN